MNICKVKVVGTEREPCNSKHPNLISVLKVIVVALAAKAALLEVKDMTLHGRVAFFKAMVAALTVKAVTLRW